MARIVEPAVIPVNGDKNRCAIGEADSAACTCNAPRCSWRGRWCAQRAFLSRMIDMLNQPLSNAGIHLEDRCEFGFTKRKRVPGKVARLGQARSNSWDDRLPFPIPLH